jgi:hypothetical protein
MLHFDGTFFRVINAPSGLPIAGPTGMLTLEVGRMTRWPAGIDGPQESTPLFFTPQSPWVSPSGRLYAADRGLLVTEP